ncbi:hypothetical protein FA09DRAFT_331671 [Tilletiopsis washingtonensis]|uniref:Uncharacterized protein n=1 Tax=Tilletiopsis washingtonensis TaxID=58919 RepID=A0A316Z553_9BASI|nr:hypothetical protein FA09DRAFT_331671 [Tilletiopsis washingtonensis]PWN96088.1 hypothetical protein FA09DRAFT_331671 [Tilletiopsis washingtonensis]
MRCSDEPPPHHFVAGAGQQPRKFAAPLEAERSAFRGRSDVGSKKRERAQHARGSAEAALSDANSSAAPTLATSFDSEGHSPQPGPTPDVGPDIRRSVTCRCKGIRESL